MEGRIDFFVGPIGQTISSTDLAVEKLFDHRRIVVARTGHPLADATTLAALVDARWVRPALSRSSEADFEEMFEAAGLPRPRIVLHTRSALVTLLAVTNSDLLTILPQQWLEFPAALNQLVALNIVQPLVAPPICIVRRRDLPLTPLAEHFCDLMRRVAGHYARRHRRSP